MGIRWRGPAAAAALDERQAQVGERRRRRRPSRRTSRTRSPLASSKRWTMVGLPRDRGAARSPALPLKRAAHLDDVLQHRARRDEQRVARLQGTSVGPERAQVDRRRSRLRPSAADRVRRAWPAPRPALSAARRARAARAATPPVPSSYSPGRRTAPASVTAPPPGPGRGCACLPRRGGSGRGRRAARSAGGPLAGDAVAGHLDVPDAAARRDAACHENHAPGAVAMRRPARRPGAPPRR